MTGAISAFIQATSVTERGTALALFRILAGWLVVRTVGVVWWHGTVPLIWIDAQFGGIRDLGDGPWLVAALGGPTPAVVWPLVYATMLSGVLLMLGVGGRFTALVTGQLFLALTSIHGGAGGSYDQLLRNGLWLVFLGGCTQTLSVDCRVRTGSWTSDAPAPAWARWLLGFQLLVVYWTTGLQKVSAFWTPGGDFSALYYIFQQPSWQKYEDMTWVAHVYPLTQLATALTWCWEVSIPVWALAWYYRERGSDSAWARRFARARVFWVYAVLGIVFHAGIWLFMDVGPFGEITLAFYTAFFGAAWWEERWRGVRGA